MYSTSKIGRSKFEVLLLKYTNDIVIFGKTSKEKGEYYEMLWNGVMTKNNSFKSNFGTFVLVDETIQQYANICHSPL